MTLVLAALVAALAPPQVSMGRSGDDGPRFAVATLEGPTSVAALQLRAGWRDDGPTPGLVRFLQRAFVEANRAWPSEALLQAVRASAVRLELREGPDTCELRLSGDTAAVKELFPKLVAAVLAPKLDDAQLKAVQRRPDAAALLAPGDASVPPALLAALFGPRPKPTGKPFPPAAIKKTLKALFVPANALVVSAGGLTQADVEAMLSPHHGGAPNAREPSAPKLPLEVNGAGPVAFRARGGTFSLGSAAHAATLRVAQELLGLELAERFQKEGLGEDVRGLTLLAPEAQALVVLVLGQDQPTAAPDPLVVAALEDLRKGTVDAELFARARQLAQRRLERDWRSPGCVADELLATGGVASWSGAEVQAALEASKKDDFAQSVKELLPAGTKLGVTQKLPAGLRSAALPVMPEEWP